MGSRTYTALLSTKKSRNEMNDRSCGKLPVRLLIIKVEPELLQPTNPSSSFVLVFDYLFTEGGSTAAVLTLHTVVLARVGRRCQIV